MSSVRIVLMTAAAAGLAVSCGGGDRLTTDDPDQPPTESGEAAESVLTAAESPAIAPASPVAATTTAQLEQPAVWPAADVVFETPEEAAEDFLAGVFGSPPELTLSEFLGGDSRSGEIDLVYFSAGVTSPRVTSTLLMRKLAPNDGWFVLAAVTENETITTPESGSIVPPGSVTVRGVADGQETTIYVSAFPAGNADAEIDSTFTSGGLYEPAPYETVLDLTEAPAGFVAIMAQGGSGLDAYVEGFTMIPVIIGLPGTR